MTRRFRAQRGSLGRSLKTLERGLRRLRQLRKKLDSRELSSSVRDKLSFRIGRLAWRLRCRSQKRLPLLFQRLPSLSRGNTSLAEDLWSQLGKNFRQPSDGRWRSFANSSANSALLSALGAQKAVHIRSGFFGHINQMLEQPLATNRLRRFFEH